MASLEPGNAVPQERILLFTNRPTSAGADPCPTSTTLRYNAASSSTTTAGATTIERVWWRLHEAVTRNHRCHTMQELLDLTFEWFDTRTNFRVQSSVYAEMPGK